MIAAFFHARQDPTWANIAIKAALEHLSCPLVHLTDEDSPQLDGCHVLREAWDGKDPMVFRAKMLARLEGEVLSLDTDVVVQHDLCKVFQFPFDVAVTRRYKPIYDPTGHDLTKSMPFNAGVHWSRGAFRKDLYRFCVENVGAYKWYIDQIGLAHLAPKYDCLTLDCDNFNYTPGSGEENVSQRLAVHYKGKRKEWMRRHA